MEIYEFVPDESHRTDLEGLLFQLSGKRRTIDLTKHSDVYCVGAFDGKILVGFAQLFILRKTTFIMSLLEDVVVHQDYRGQGVGKRILNEIVNLAKQKEVVVINLTTRQERKDAIHLFTSMGFIEPGNSVFRLVLKN